MNIALGDILEPIVPLCSSKDNKPWNDIIKVHLKNPSVDGAELLIERQIFALFLDGPLRIPKIAKSHDNTTSKEILTMKIKSKSLKTVQAHQLLAEIVLTNFHRGQEFKVIQINKNQGETFAYITAASPEQCQKNFTHQLAYNWEIISPMMASDGTILRNEI